MGSRLTTPHGVPRRVSHGCPEGLRASSQGFGDTAQGRWPRSHPALALPWLFPGDNIPLGSRPPGHIRPAAGTSWRSSQPWPLPRPHGNQSLARLGRGRGLGGGLQASPRARGYRVPGGPLSCPSVAGGRGQGQRLNQSCPCGPGILLPSPPPQVWHTGQHTPNPKSLARALTESPRGRWCRDGGVLCWPEV